VWCHPSAVATESEIGIKRLARELAKVEAEGVENWQTDQAQVSATRVQDRGSQETRMKGTVEGSELFEGEMLGGQASPLDSLETQLDHIRMPLVGLTETHGRMSLEEIPPHQGVDTGPLHL